MNLMDTLNPQTVNVTGARRVLNMTQRDDKTDLKYAEEMDLTKYLQKKTEEELKAGRRAREVRRRRIARLRNAVKRARGKLEIAERILRRLYAKRLAHLCK